MTDKWSTALNLLNLDTAANPLGLNYKIAKHFYDEIRNLIVFFFNLTLDLSIILLTWQTSNIFIISKLNRYHYNIQNTRSIALFDIFRKIATKILSSRFSTLINQFLVLQDHNFCDLKDKLTEDFIHLVNTIIEDTKQNNKKL